MNFTPWQINALVRGLWRYRVKHGINGSLLPWKTMLDRILTSGVTANTYPKDGGLPAFREEALRRFCEKGTTLKPDKLDDVYRFLVRVGIIDKDSFTKQRGPLDEALQVHDALANTSETAKKYLKALQPVYESQETRADKLPVLIRLVLGDAKYETLLAVEEQVVVAPGGHVGEKLATLGEKERSHWARVVRQGYAFAMSSPPTLHVFLRGPDADDRIHYVGVGLAGDDDFRPVGFVRSGQAVDDLASMAKTADVLAVFPRFAPAEARSDGE